MVLRRQDNRGLTTLLFTDIIGSTDIAIELGDRRIPPQDRRQIGYTARVRVAYQPRASVAAASTSDTARKVSWRGQYWLAGW